MEQGNHNEYKNYDIAFQKCWKESETREFLEKKMIKVIKGLSNETIANH